MQNDDVDVPVENAEPAEPSSCRHCGATVSDAPTDGSDWLCPECERHQHTVQCPTCKQPVDVSLLPADAVPAPHAPQRRRKG